MKHEWQKPVVNYLDEEILLGTGELAILTAQNLAGFLCVLELKYRVRSDRLIHLTQKITKLHCWSGSIDLSYRLRVKSEVKTSEWLRPGHVSTLPYKETKRLPRRKYQASV